MRFIHTGDWHLGHRLHNHSRREEQQTFLDWLLDQLGEQEADALLIAGDLYHSPNPPAEAESMFYDFVYRAKQRYPSLQIVLIGGNHDSPVRLEVPRPLMRRMGVHIVGRLPRRPDQRTLDPDRLLIPLLPRALHQPEHARLCL